MECVLPGKLHPTAYLFLQSKCNVELALIGGELLLPPRFAHEVVYYAARKGSGV